MEGVCKYTNTKQPYVSNLNRFLVSMAGEEGVLKPSLMDSERPLYCTPLRHLYIVTRSCLLPTILVYTYLHESLGYSVTLYSHVSQLGNYTKKSTNLFRTLKIS